MEPSIESSCATCWSEIFLLKAPRNVQSNIADTFKNVSSFLHPQKEEIKKENESLGQEQELWVFAIKDDIFSICSEKE